MTGWQWNGREFTPCATLPIEDRGFRYGMSVFETIAVIGGKPRFLPEHLTRLEKAALQCNFNIPSDILTGANLPEGAFPATGVARIYITAEHRVLLLVEQRHRVLKSSYILSPEPVVHLPFPAGLKSGNYWRNMNAVQEAQAAGFDEALLVSPTGVLISACMANVFLVSDGTLMTPGLSSGARNGIIREWIKKQEPVIESDLRVPDVIAADEIFLTNSWIGVMPVTGFHGEGRAAGAITLTLRDKLEHNLRTQ